MESIKKDAKIIPPRPKPGDSIKVIFEDDGNIWEGKDIEIKNGAAYANVEMPEYETISREELEKMLKKLESMKEELKCIDKKIEITADIPVGKEWDFDR